MPDPSPEQLSAEDAKLVILARATRARVGAAEGAAVRDLDGRTYAAATVDLPSLQLSAVQGTVAMAVASGARGLEACVLVGASLTLAEPDHGALSDLAGTGVIVHFADERGTVVTSATT